MISWISRFLTHRIAIRVSFLPSPGQGIDLCVGAVEALNEKDIARHRLHIILWRAIDDGKTRLRFLPLTDKMQVFTTMNGRERELVPIRPELGKSIIDSAKTLAGRRITEQVAGKAAPIVDVRVRTPSRTATLYLQLMPDSQGEGLTVAIDDPTVQPESGDLSQSRRLRELKEAHFDSLSGTEYLHEYIACHRAWEKQLGISSKDDPPERTQS